MFNKEITHKDKKIFYRTTGDGPLVVLLHGVPFDGNLWINQFHAFPGFKLVIPDLPGSGRSEMIEDMSMEGMADCVKEIIVHEKRAISPVGGDGGGCAIVIGHSMGGYITLALAEKYPDLLNGFGLFHSTAYADSEEKKGARRKIIDSVREKAAEEFVKTSVPNLFSPITKNENPGLIEEQIELSCNFSAETIVSYQEAMIRRPDRTKILKTSRTPVLFVLGKYDTAVPLKDGLEQCSLADLNYIHILETAGHVGMKEAFIETNTVLLNYLTNTCHQTQ